MKRNNENRMVQRRVLSITFRPHSFRLLDGVLKVRKQKRGGIPDRVHIVAEVDSHYLTTVYLKSIPPCNLILCNVLLFLCSRGLLLPCLQRAVRRVQREDAAVGGPRAIRFGWQPENHYLASSADSQGRNLKESLLSRQMQAGAQTNT